MKDLPLDTRVRKIGRKTVYSKKGQGHGDACSFSRRGRLYNQHMGYEWLYAYEIELAKEAS